MRIGTVQHHALGTKLWLTKALWYKFAPNWCHIGKFIRKISNAVRSAVFVLAALVLFIAVLTLVFLLIWSLVFSVTIEKIF